MSLRRSSLLRLALLSIAVLLASLAGCGFHLRGSVELPPAARKVYFSGIARDSALGVALERQVLRNGGQVLAAAPTAVAALGIAVRRNETRRNVLSVDASGKASEYELSYIVHFQILSPGGEALTGEQRILQVRDLFFDASNVLAKSDEENQLRAEMVEAAAAQILRQLVAVARDGTREETAQ